MTRRCGCGGEVAPPRQNGVWGKFCPLPRSGMFSCLVSGVNGAFEFQISRAILSSSKLQQVNRWQLCIDIEKRKALCLIDPLITTNSRSAPISGMPSAKSGVNMSTGMRSPYFLCTPTPTPALKNQDFDSDSEPKFQTLTPGRHV